MVKEASTDARLAQKNLDKLANIAQMSQKELEKLKKERETASNTHLRAHETGRNLECRLLLEKKKKKKKKKKQKKQQKRNNL